MAKRAEYNKAYHQKQVESLPPEPPKSPTNQARNYSDMIKFWRL